jgi:hypothetical protein
MREVITTGRGKLHNKKLHDMYTSPYFVLVINSRMSWTGQIAYMAEKKCTQSFGGET